MNIAYMYIYGMRDSRINGIYYVHPAFRMREDGCGGRWHSQRQLSDSSSSLPCSRIYVLQLASMARSTHDLSAAHTHDLSTTCA